MWIIQDNLLLIRLNAEDGGIKIMLHSAISYLL